MIKFEPLYKQQELINVSFVAKDSNCIELFKEIDFIRKFFDNYFDLQFGKNYVFLMNTSLPPFSINIILSSAQQTLGSFEACCRLGNFSDAYILLRKYRDDLFFYLYITLVEREQSNINSSTVRNIELWMNNKLQNLHVSDILQYIGNSERLSDVVKKYGLKKSFKNIGTKLNDFVHANGISFYNEYFLNYTVQNGVQDLCKNLIMILNYITVIFVFLSALCKPISIMSSDYVDYLDCNETPPEGSQYWVAPFIVEFFEQRKELIDSECLKYLQENTNMELLET